MNAQPHTHKVEIRRTYSSAGGTVIVTYGDTRVSTARWWQRMFGETVDNNPSEKQVRKAVAKAIRKHDEGSRVAGAQADHLDRLRAEYADLPADRWGSEVLR